MIGSGNPESPFLDASLPEGLPLKNTDLPSLELNRPDGSVQKVSCKYFEKVSLQLHFYEEYDDLFYDIPSDGIMNVLLCVPNEHGVDVPIAAASLDLGQDGVPMISMIQMVKALVPVPFVDKPGGLVRTRRNFDKIDHPQKDLQRGQNKIPWQETLITICKKLMTQNGYDTIRLQSGFATKYAATGHDLPLSVQQYDNLVRNQSDWTPFAKEHDEPVPITGKSLEQLNTVIRKLRDKKYSSITDVLIAKTLAYTDLKIPEYWETKLQK